MKLFSLFFALFICLSAKPIISVSIPPQAYFLKQIAQDTITINTLIPQGSDPHTFEFKPQTIQKLQKSDLYHTIGLEFEEIWIPKIKNNLSRTKIIPITQTITFLPTQEDSHSHSSHHNNDPHIWLSPILVKTLAQNIAEILIAHYPHYKNLYEKNLQQFLSQIDLLHHTIKNKLKILKNRNFLVYHPSWAYFAHTYNLNEISIQTEGRVPTAKELSSIIALIKQNQIKTIFIQNGFSSNLSLLIAKDYTITPWIVDPLSYEWEKELLHFTEGLLQ